MSDVTRLWLLAPTDLGGALVLPAELELAGVVSASASEVPARALAAAHGAEYHADPDLGDPTRLAAALDRWALRCARAQCALVCSPAAVQRVVGEALGVGEAARFELRPGGCATLDWPVTGAASGSAPALVGFDLDWIPVFLSTGRPKFPGGPGVASSGRA